MHRFAICLLLAAACVLCGPLPPGQAQSRITQDQLSQLQDKVKAQRDAYLRFEAAEQEAAQEGMAERAATFREAKAKAHTAYIALNAELSKVQDAKHAQDKADQLNNPER